MPRKARGYQVIFDPDPRHGMPSVVECDLTECNHCNKVIFVSPGDDVCWCTCCDARICDTCERKGICDPIEEKIKRWEARGALEQAMRTG